MISLFRENQKQRSARLGTWLCLPGAIGSSLDWEMLIPWLPQEYQYITLDWRNIEAQWSTVHAHLERALAGAPRPWFLLAYSQGARIALHTLCHHPTPFSGAILFGANPGFEKNEERVKRAEADRRWAEKARSDPWDQFLKTWELQSVFISGNPPEMWPDGLGPVWQATRRAMANDRESVARQFEQWSLASQPNLWPLLPTVDKPICWVAGAEDTKFAAIARRAASLHPHSTLATLPHTRHRIPWESPHSLAPLIRGFAQKRK